jgi:glycosyltransferase involved in cell wall biosynthesis
LKIAWFSPLPPDRSGIAAYSAEVLPLLAARGHAVDAFVAANAHDFVWKARRNAYDLTVFHLGNAACHDYMWAYLFRYPGLVVLHDAQVHQARALALTKRWLPRRDDYLAEFRANHPDAPPAIGDVVAAGFGESLFQHWPHIRLIVESARMVVVHNRRLADDLRASYPRARVESVDMGVADPFSENDPATGPVSGSAHGRQASAALIRARHGMPADAMVVGAFGGITAEKRIDVLLRALSACRARHPTLRLMLVGATVPHYDVHGEARRWGVSDYVHVTGYVADDQLPEYLLAADVCACLRWPTNRETSASWVRCLAAARPTLVTELADLGDVPMLDPRGWHRLDTQHPPREPVTVAIDIVDEPHCVHLALDRLAADAALRAQLGRAARVWWHAHHRLERMADAYDDLMQAAARLPAPKVALPGHLVDDATSRGRALVAEMGVASRLHDVIG